MSKKSEAVWNALYLKSDSLYWLTECGCLALVVVDMPDVIKDCRADILEQALKGRTMHRSKRGNLPPLNCPTHEAERQARKAASEVNA